MKSLFRDRKRKRVRKKKARKMKQKKNPSELSIFSNFHVKIAEMRLSLFGYIGERWDNKSHSFILLTAELFKTSFYVPSAYGLVRLIRLLRWKDAEREKAANVVVVKNWTISTPPYFSLSCSFHCRALVTWKPRNSPQFTQPPTNHANYVR